jgi:hypothetical protein
LKKKQLMELAIINGTYRDGSKLTQKLNPILISSGGATLATQAAMAAMNSGLRSPPNHLGGPPLIISPRIANIANNAANHNASLLNGTGATQFIATQSGDPSAGLIYAAIPTIYSDPTGALAAQGQTLLEYPNGYEISQAGIFCC